MPPEPMRPQDVEELLGAYALDAVDDDERRIVEDYLATNPRARAEVQQHREVATMLAFTGAPAPEGLWDRIAASIEGQPPQPGPELAKVLPVTGRRRGRSWWLVAGRHRRGGRGARGPPHGGVHRARPRDRPLAGPSRCGGDPPALVRAGRRGPGRATSSTCSRDDGKLKARAVIAAGRFGLPGRPGPPGAGRAGLPALGGDRRPGDLARRARQPARCVPVLGGRRLEGAGHHREQPGGVVVTKQQPALTGHAGATAGGEPAPAVRAARPPGRCRGTPRCA